MWTNFLKDSLIRYKAKYFIDIEEKLITSFRIRTVRRKTKIKIKILIHIQIQIKTLTLIILIIRHPSYSRSYLNL